MRKCLKTIVTPASASLFIGGLTAGILFITSHTKGNDTTSVASQYISAFANLAAENVIAGLCTTGGITTALFYTFFAKPVETLHKKCCGSEESAEHEEESTPYNRI